MKRKKPLELFVEFRKNAILDHNGNHVSIDEARRLWESGQVTNCNLAFQRLATRANWDFTELARQYAVEDAVRNLLKS